MTSMTASYAVVYNLYSFSDDVEHNNETQDLINLKPVLYDVFYAGLFCLYFAYDFRLGNQSPNVVLSFKSARCSPTRRLTNFFILDFL